MELEWYWNEIYLSISLVVDAAIVTGCCVGIIYKLGYDGSWWFLREQEQHQQEDTGHFPQLSDQITRFLRQTLQLQPVNAPFALAFSR